MNSTKTVSVPTPTPTRRQALTGLFGMATAATAGMAAAPKAAPAARGAGKTFAEEYAITGEEYYRLDAARRLSPEGRLEAECQAVLMPVFIELLDALDTVQDQHADECEDAPCEWCDDLAGLRYFVNWMAEITESDMQRDLFAAAEREAQWRAAQEAAEGTHHDCPVLRAHHAIDRLATALSSVSEKYAAAGAEDTQLAEDAEVWAWGLVQLRAGCDNQGAVRMKDAAREALLRENIENMAARGELTRSVDGRLEWARKDAYADKR